MTAPLNHRQSASERKRWEKRAADAYDHAAECVRDGDHDGALAVASAASEALRVALGERQVGDLDDWFVDNLEALDG